MANSVTVTEENFDQMVLKANTPMLVDFWAPWCAPCVAVAPILEELAAEYEGKIGIARLNVDDAPTLSSRYGISAIPNLIIFNGGKPVSQIVGYRPKAELKKALDQTLT
ncbi:MAG: thioredoxin [Dehalococcoidia bacterium]|jgi:thioredoxin 1|nr:thioredoxin [Chloroflexota bacterium]MCK4242530.1 thioredoxin [Dehalococcoidia bacterium]